MFVEFFQMTQRVRHEAPVERTGAVTLHQHGDVDILGNAMEHAGAIVAAIDSADASRPVTEVPAAFLAGASCQGCPLAAGPRGGCSCLQADRVRLGEKTIAASVLLRPGLPVAVAEGTDGFVRNALARELSNIQAIRRRSDARSAAA